MVVVRVPPPRVRVADIRFDWWRGWFRKSLSGERRSQVEAPDFLERYAGKNLNCRRRRRHLKAGKMLEVLAQPSRRSL